MGWRTNGLVLKLRKTGRILGLNRWIVYFFYGDGYETIYEQQLSNSINQGDCVWDIGANIGYYTRNFSECVGMAGSVFSFEPSPVNFKRLSEQCSTLSNVTLLQYGLGNANETLSLQQGDDELGATSRIVKDDATGMVVEVRHGDSLVADGVVRQPNVVKIDVEGFEVEVLEGITNLLMHEELRVIGLEVHFGLLEDRGLGDAPQKIEQKLRGLGFLVSWPDSSHMLAQRSV